ncbi:diacylglycerol acyltransferase [Colletotrichum navitas]|uniref:diacylglycerol O-acyltransferase n=1 Tax=Colletotrichum navitas TaxID=681940 RepID=A0AAD8QFA3_9PEZI|nr:diacylglycerol acyltransferase [Colletotrichum navitas]KAK1600238.1 diacylglycerol acyltransferase [Colletotrichum navitas]
MPRKKNTARSKSPSKGQSVKSFSNPQLASQSVESGNAKINIVAEAPELGPTQTSTKDIQRPATERQESSHKYSATGPDDTSKTPTQDHRQSPSAVMKNDSKVDDESNGHAADPEKSYGSEGTADETLVDGFEVDRSDSTCVKAMSDDSYPRIASGAQGRRYSMHGQKTGGIRFAPLQVPFQRRLQTAAVLFHGLSILIFVSIFFFLAALPLAWPLLVPYLIHLSLSGVASNGNLTYRSEWLRSLPIWRFFADYYPAALHKTHDLPPTRKYIFGYHPHGIISHGAFAAFATNALGFAEKFPGITNSLLTLDSNFRIPFYRDYILFTGVRSVSKESIWNTLSKGGINGEGMGRAVTIVVGGARESLEAQPGTLRLILKGRKGFIKMALRTGADLVPVLGFGENDLYDQLSPKYHPWVHNFQMFVLRVFKFTLPALHGRGILNYDVGMMPYRRPLNVVVGKPIKVTTPPTAQPPQEEIDRLHGLYVAELQTIWDSYKDQFAPDRKAEIQFIA